MMLKQKHNGKRPTWSTGFAVGGSRSTGALRDTAHQLYPQHAKFLLSGLRAFRPPPTFCAIVIRIDFAANRYLFLGFRPNMMELKAYIL